MKLLGSGLLSTECAASLRQKAFVYSQMSLQVGPYRSTNRRIGERKLFTILHGGARFKTPLYDLGRVCYANKVHKINRRGGGVVVRNEVLA